MTEDVRPKWAHKISEADVRWLATGVTKITHHWEMTGADTSRNWIELHKEKQKEKRAFPADFLNANDYFQFNPNWRELVVPTYYGERALKDLETIDAWEKQNQRDRAELARLKKKFGETA